MLCAMPDSFFSAVLMDEQSFKLPPLGDYAVGMVRACPEWWTGVGGGGGRACVWAWPCCTQCMAVVQQRAHRHAQHTPHTHRETPGVPAPR
jgi:hypothetical protein